MARPGTVIGWLLDEDCRELLLDRFKPSYEKTVAHHVTLSTGATAQTPLPPDVRATVVGHVDDQKGVQALVVTTDGSTDRPDGSTEIRQQILVERDAKAMTCSGSSAGRQSSSPSRSRFGRPASDGHQATAPVPRL